jgi:hypothetical protein
MKFRNFVAACAVGIAVVGAAGVARAADVRMFVHHEVTDYAAWRKSYNSFAPTQKKHEIGRAHV